MGILKTEEIHKEIDLVQGCITRMNSCSFYVKGWFISLTTVIIALEHLQLDRPFVLLLLSLTLVFWFFDAFYIAYERSFRELYSWNLTERSRNSRIKLYDLDIKQRFKPNILKACFSSQLILLYGTAIVICIALFLNL